MSSRLEHRGIMDILRISLEVLESPRAREQSAVVFEVTHQEETSFRTSVPARELGLFGRSEYTADRFRYKDADFEIPEAVTRRLQDHLWTRRGDPLWVELDPSGGRLSFVPWEDLLRPYVRGSVLRLPR